MESSIRDTQRFLAPLCDMLPLEYELMYRTGVFLYESVQIIIITKLLAM